MPTTLSTFDDAEVRMRFREPYVTEGLNQKMAINTASGVYRGFKLATNASANTVTITADPDSEDNHAVFRTSTNFAVSISKLGSFNVSLASLVVGFPRTLAICLFADYTVGQPTVAYVRAYEIAPTDEFTVDANFENLVVLGTVVLPAGGGVISAGSITPSLRRSAWEGRATEAFAWSPLIRNSGFEWGADGATVDRSAAYWRKSVTTGTGTISTEAGIGRNGTAGQQFDVTAGTVANSLRQYLNIPVVPGQLYRVSCWKKCTDIPTAGSYVVQLQFGNQSGVATAPVTFPISVSATNAAFVEISEIREVAVGDVQLLSAAIVGTGLTGVSQLQIDDFQVWLAPPSTAKSDESQLKSGMGDLAGTSLMLVDPATQSGAGLTSEAALLDYDNAADKVTLTGRGATPAPSLEVPSVNVLGAATAGSVAATGSIAAATANISGTATAATGVTTGATTLGGNLLGSVANADTARITAAASTFAGVEYTLMWQSVPSGAAGYRKYVKPDGTFVETWNCFWNNTTNIWTRDVNGTISSKLESSAYGIKQRSRWSGLANTWDDTDTINGWNFSAPWATTPIGAAKVGYSFRDEFVQLAAPWSFTASDANGSVTTPSFGTPASSQYGGVQITSLTATGKYIFIDEWVQPPQLYGWSTAFALLDLTTNTTFDMGYSGAASDGFYLSKATSGSDVLSMKISDNNNAMFTHATTFSVVQGTLYYATMALLTTSSVMLRIGTTPEWKSTDYYQTVTTIGGTNVHGYISGMSGWWTQLKSPTALSKRMDLAFVELFSQKIGRIP